MRDWWEDVGHEPRRLGGGMGARSWLVALPLSWRSSIGRILSSHTTLPQTSSTRSDAVMPLHSSPLNPRVVACERFTHAAQLTLVHLTSSAVATRSDRRHVHLQDRQARSRQGPPCRCRHLHHQEVRRHFALDPQHGRPQRQA